VFHEQQVRVGGIEVGQGHRPPFGQVLVDPVEEVPHLLVGQVVAQPQGIDQLLRPQVDPAQARGHVYDVGLQEGDAVRATEVAGGLGSRPQRVGIPVDAGRQRRHPGAGQEVEQLLGRPAHQAGDAHRARAKKAGRRLAEEVGHPAEPVAARPADGAGQEPAVQQGAQPAVAFRLVVVNPLQDLSVLGITARLHVAARHGGAGHEQGEGFPKDKAADPLGQLRRVAESEHVVIADL
jgi:hypothetical protein